MNALRVSCLGLSVLSLLSAPLAQGQTMSVWNGGGGDNSWSNTANWVGGVPPPLVSTNFVALAGATRLNTVANTNWSILGLIISNNAGAFTIGGSNLTLTAMGVTGGVTNSFEHFGANTVVISNNIVLPTDPVLNRRSFVIGAAGGATFNGFITNSGADRSDLYIRGSGAGVGTINGRISIGTNFVFKTDPGTWVIGANNNIWGKTELDSTGTLRIAATDALPTNTLVQFDTSMPRLDLNNFNQTVVGLTGTGMVRTGTGATGGRLTVSDLGATNVYRGYIVENGSLVKTGPGTFTLQPPSPNSYTNGTTVNGGVLRLNFSNSGANYGTIRGPLTINPGATVEAAVEKALGFANSASGNVTVVTINGGSLIFSGLNGLGGGQTYLVTGGAIQSNGGTNSPTGSGYFRFGGGGTDPTFYTLATNVSSTISGRIQLDAAAVFNTAQGTVVGGPDLLVNAAIAGPSTLTKAGTGSMRLMANNTYTGATAVTGGTLALGAGAAISNSVLISLATGTVFDVSAASTFAPTIRQTIYGYGVITGQTVMLDGGAILTPGLPGVAGTLTINADVIMSGTSTYTNLFDLTNNVTTGGGNDFLAVNGNNFEPINSQIRVNPLVPLATGTYTLISYGTASKTSSFATPVLGNTTRDTWTLNEGGGLITMTVDAGTNQVLVWSPVGVASNWDIGISANWTNVAVPGIQDTYYDLDTVLFDDSGAASSSIGISTIVRPAAVTVSSSSNYTFASGPGMIGNYNGIGATLTKDGTGTLTILNTNTYGGTTTVSNGVLQVGNGGAFGAIGTGNVAVVGSGVFSYFRNDAAGAFNNNVSGNGTVIFRSTNVINVGSFILGGTNNSFTGTIVATNARVVVGSTNAVGAASLVNVQDFGQIYHTAGTIAQPLQLTGIGWTENAGNLGAIRFQGGQWNGPITLAGNARIGAYGGNGTIGGPISGPFEADFWCGEGTARTITIGPSSPSTYASTRISSNVIVVATNANAFSTGPLVMNGGTLRVNGNSFSFSNIGNTAAGGTIANVSVSNGATITVGADNSDSSYSALLLNNTTQPANTTPVLSVTKTGTGTLTIVHAGATGTNTVSQGTLVITNGSWSGPLSIAAGATAIAVGGPGLVGEYYSVTPLNVNNTNPLFATPATLSAYLATNTANMLYKSTAAGANFDFGSGGAAFPPGYSNGAQNFQSRWIGKLTVTNAGIWTFSTGSDDGNMLWIDGTNAVNNNIYQGFSNRTATVGLAAGLHDIVVGYFQGTGGYGLTISNTPAGGASGPLPNSALSSGAGIGSLSGAAGSTLIVSNGLLYIGQKQDGVFSGNISGDGGLLKAGPAMLTLNGNNSYTDATTIVGGTLLANSGIPNAAPVTINYGTLSVTGTVAGSVTAQDGGVIAPTLSGAPSTLSIGGPLALSAGATNVFAFSATTNDLIAVPGSMTINGAGVTINPQAAIANGTYTIATYGTLAGTYRSAVANINPAASLNNLSLDYSVPNEIRLVVASRPSIRWNSSSNTIWDVNGMTNWFNSGFAANDVFYNTDAVLFDDTPGVTQIVSVASGLSVAPSSITVNTSTNAFTIQIAGAITGNCSLVKNGTNTLTLSDTTGATGANQNFATGTVTVNDGKLILLGQNDGARTAGSGLITVNPAGVLQTDSANTFGQQGTGILNPVLLDGGRFRPNGNNHMNSLTLQNNAIVERYNSAGGAGLDFYALTGTPSAVINVLSTSITITNDGRMTIANSTNNTIINVVDSAPAIDAEFSAQISGVAGRYIVLTNTGTLLLSGPNDNNSLMGIVENGTLLLGKTGAAIRAFGGNPGDGLIIRGSTSSTVRLVGPGPDQIYGLVNVRLDAGIFDLNGWSESYNGLNGTNGVILNSAVGTIATNTVGESNSNGVFNGLIRDGGGQLVFRKIGTGIQVLTGTNTYTGGTIINAGVLSVPTLSDGGPSAIGNSGALSFGGGTLQYTEAGVVGTSRSVTNPGASTFDVSNSIAVLTLSGSVSGAGAITKLGSGTLALAGTNFITGTITVSTGTLNFTESSSNSVQQFTIGTGIGRVAVNQTNGFVVSGGATGILIGNSTTGNVAQYTLSGGTLQALATGNRGIILGVNNGATGYFYMVSGILTGNQLQVSRSEGSAAIGSGGYFYQSGGNAAFASIGIAGASGQGANNANEYGLLSVSGGNFIAGNWLGFGGGNNATGQIYLGTGGTLTLPAFPTTRGTSAYADMTIDGGQLIPFAASTTYMSGLNHAYLTANGAYLNVPTNSDIAIAQALENAPSQTGPLTKLGGGVLTLSGINTYGGTTVVNAGTLLVNGSNSGAGNFTVASNATLWGTGVISTASATISTGGWIGARSAAIATGKLTLASVTLDSGAQVSALLRGTNPTVRITGNLGSSPAVAVQVIPVAASAVGTNVLIDYDGSFTGNISDFSLISVPNGGQGYLDLNTGNSSIDLVTTNVGLGITWDGAVDSNWKVGGALNWKSILSSNASQFATYDTVIFDDTATGTYTVNVAEIVLPGSLVVSNNTKDYAFMGNGVGGTIGLAKYGAAKLTLSGANTYTGQTVVSAGTLSINSDASLGAAPAAVVSNQLRLSAGTMLEIFGNTTLVANRGIQVGTAGSAGSVTLSVPTNILATIAGKIAVAPTATSGVTKAGSGILTLSSSNSINGPVNVQGGTVRVGVLGALANNSGITISDGARVDLNGISQANVFYNYSIAGTGPDGRGAIINTNASVSGNSSVRWLTLTADATIGALGIPSNEGNRFDVYNSQGNGFTLTKVGNSSVSMRDASTNLQLIVNEGFVYTEAVTNGLGTNNIVNSGGSLAAYGSVPGRLLMNPVILNGGTLASRHGANSGAVTWAGPITLTADSFIATKTLTYATEEGIVVAGSITGTNNLTILGNASNAVFLGTNTYTGGTIIHGRLQIGANGTTGGSIVGNIVDNNQLILRRTGTLLLGGDISGTGLVNIAGSGTTIFGGTNTFTGGITVSTGSVVALNSQSLGSGTKIVDLTNGSAGQPNLTLDGSGGNITFATGITFRTSFAAAGSITNKAGDNTILGPVNMTSGGGDSMIKSVGGSLTLAGPMIFIESNRVVRFGGTSTGSNTVSGVIQTSAGYRNVGIIKDDAGTWTFAADNTYPGGNLINAGILNVGNGAASGTISTNSVTNNATLVFNRSDSYTQPGIIFGSGTLVQNGTGTLILQQNELYTGPTFVSNGTLRIDGSILSPVSIVTGKTLLVNGTLSGNVTADTGAIVRVQGLITGSVTLASGTTLGGTGVIRGAVTSDGTVSPGNSAGLLTMSRDFNQTTGGVLNIEIGGATLPGVDYDELIVSNTATLGGELKVSLINGYNPTITDIFFVVSAQSITDPASTNLPTLTGGLMWKVQNLGSILILSITNTPPTGYDAWAAQITGTNTAYNQSALGDGYPNLLKYATGSSPTNSDNLASMSAARLGGILQLLFNHDTNATDISLIVEGAYTSTNDATWNGIATNIAGSWGSATNVVENTATNPASVTVSDPAGPSTNRFLRLRVTRP